MEDSKYSYVAKFELTFIWILNDRKFHANVKTILIWSAKDTWPQVHFGIFGRHLEGAEQVFSPFLYFQVTAVIPSFPYARWSLKL